MEVSHQRKKHDFIFLISTIVFSISFIVCFSSSTAAYPVTSREAEAAARNWLASSPVHFGRIVTDTKVSRVETYEVDSGSNFFYVVYLEPKGFIVLPADDRLEPIIVFSPDAIAFVPSDQNPLGALVTLDISWRLDTVEVMEKSSAASEIAVSAQQKWNRLLDPTDRTSSRGYADIDDVRVAPLVQSKWSQATVGGEKCYNYYTPNNYVCGCVATAMAQIMRFHQWPATAVGTPTFTIKVDGVEQDRSLIGGDGAGGPYNWANMPLDPKNEVLTEAQRQAIGKLTHDAGVSCGMWYTQYGSGATTLAAAIQLVETFGYGNCVEGNSYDTGNTGIPPAIFSIVAQPNLDAGYPFILSISGEQWHAVVCDGYGYNTSTLYHHLNIGAGGSYDAWFNLPTVDAYYNYDALEYCTYNIFKEGAGEIISGRVMDSLGTPLTGVTVAAVPGEYSDTTDETGIYALAKVPSDTAFTLTATKDGYYFKTLHCATGTSSRIAIGNVRGADFTALVSDIPEITGQDPLTTPEETALEITLDDLVVSDSDNVYPDDFTLSVQSGSNYTCAGNTITPITDYNGNLVVPVTVNDGYENSPSYDLVITVTAINDAPVISGQKTLITEMESSITIDLDDLIVEDPDDSFPHDFTLELFDGDHYNRSGANGFIITPEDDFFGHFSVPARVNDGADESNLYQLKVSAVKYVYVSQNFECGGDKSPCYGTITDGIDEPSWVCGVYIKVERESFYDENVVLDKDYFMEIGLDSTFENPSPRTTVICASPSNAAMTIHKGTAILWDVQLSKFGIGECGIDPN